MLSQVSLVLYLYNHFSFVSEPVPLMKPNLLWAAPFEITAADRLVFHSDIMSSITTSMNLLFGLHLFYDIQIIQTSFSFIVLYIISLYSRFALPLPITPTQLIFSWCLASSIKDDDTMNLKVSKKTPQPFFECRFRNYGLEIGLGIICICISREASERHHPSRSITHSNV